MLPKVRLIEKLVDRGVIAIRGILEEKFIKVAENLIEGGL